MGKHSSARAELARGGRFCALSHGQGLIRLCESATSLPMPPAGRPTPGHGIRVGDQQTGRPVTVNSLAKHNMGVGSAALHLARGP